MPSLKKGKHLFVFLKCLMSSRCVPIGLFDSGYGGLTIFDHIHTLLPGYDYVYLGDNARTPYGTRSFEVVYQYTLQAVQRLFAEGCPLVILACNTASAKALRPIQQQDLPVSADPTRRVLGVILPTVEVMDSMSLPKHIVVVGNWGGVAGLSEGSAVAELVCSLLVWEEACPMWVPLVENGEYDKPGADYFVQQHVARILQRDPLIDTLILGCTHYPLLAEKIRRYLPDTVTLFSQGARVAASLTDYLARHPEMDSRLSRGATARFLTTESVARVSEHASLFLRRSVEVTHMVLNAGGQDGGV